jgi:predicted LPLAT superfamily acyltransferase
MPGQRRHAATYWKALSGRAPSLHEQYRHFRSFMDSLILKLQVARGKFPEFQFSEDAHKAAFLDVCRTLSPALFGTFHVGHSDIMGCMLRDFDRRIAMVRHRVGNSKDTEIMADSFAGNLRFLWINDPAEFIFDLKDAIQRGESIALQCDRTEFSSKTDYFEFLGKLRAFPMTIYYLADLFRCPVVFSFTGPMQKTGQINVHTTRVFVPGPDRKENITAGRKHFQEVLAQLEAHLKRHPELWFNFGPLNEALKDGEDTRV